jgi:hypothetical protein
MTEDQAKQRFMVLNLVRFVGLIFVIFGVVLMSGKLEIADGPMVGSILLVFGAIEFFIVPVLIKRIWNTPNP